VGTLTAQQLNWQGNKKNKYVIREQIMGITAVATNQGRTKWITVDIQLQDINYIGYHQNK